MLKKAELPTKMPIEKALLLENLNLRAQVIRTNAEAELSRIHGQIEELAKEFCLSPTDLVKTDTGEIDRRGQKTG